MLAAFVALATSPAAGIALFALTGAYLSTRHPDPAERHSR